MIKSSLEGRFCQIRVSFDMWSKMYVLVYMVNYIRNEWWFCVLYLLTSRCVKLSMYASISGASIWLNVWNSCISLVYSAQIEKIPLNINWFLNVDSKFFMSSRRKNVIRSLKEFRGKVISSWLNRSLMSVQNFWMHGHSQNWCWIVLLLNVLEQ